MKKDKKIKPFTKTRNKEKRQRYFKLPNLKWMILILLFSIGLLVASYYAQENTWLSGVFVSAGCGGITGLVLYFLSNLRNNKYAILQKELLALNSIGDILSKIKGFTTYHLCYRKSWGPKKDIYEAGLQIVDLLDELQTIVDDISCELYDAISMDGDNPLSYENLRIFKNRLLNAEDAHDVQLCISDIAKCFEVVDNKIFELKSEKEDQLVFLGRFVI